MSVDDADNSADGRTQRIHERIATDVSAYASLTGEFYRGEMDRMTTWRSRLDQTTNWAVVVVAAILTWAFSSPDRPHYVILIGVFAVTTFLVMEAQRYREYDIWRNRARTFQKRLLADLFDPENSEDTDWQPELGQGLRNPAFSVSFRQSLTHRLRRVYVYLLLILLAAWVARVTLLEPAESWQETAGILDVSGLAIALLVAVFYVTVIVITMWSAREHRIQEFEE